jgi:capsular exopolysaccharide synthesis family protein
MDSGNNDNLFGSEKSNLISNDNLKADLLKYLKNWKWIAFCVIVSLGLSYLYLRYQPYIYQTDATIKILKGEESVLDISDLTGGGLGKSSSNLDNEIQIITSRRIVGQVVDELNLNTYYYSTGRFLNKELFGTQVPIIVNWLDSDNPDFFDTGYTFIFELVDGNTFNIKILDKEYNKNFQFGQSLDISGTKFTIEKNPLFDKFKYGEDNTPIYFTYTPKRKVISRLIKKISIEPVESSEILKLSITGENKLKNEYILNELIFKFNEDYIEDDKKVATKTKEFVSNRLGLIESELDIVESDLVDFKKTAKFADGATDAGMLLSSYTDAEQQKSVLQNQIQISNFLLDEVTSNSDYSLIPADVGLDNMNANSAIGQYNQLVLERENQLTSATTYSPAVIEMSERLELLKRNIENSIKSYIKSIEISLKNMSSREARYNSDIRNLPEKEKVAREIERQQAVKEELYIFLLQKQVEAELSAAITEPAAKIVDYSFTSNIPVSPRKMVIYVAGLFVGFFVPIGFLFLKYLFETKIVSKSQVNQVVDAPVIAEIPFNKNYTSKIIQKSDDSDVAESFRILRTNLSYLNVLRDKKDKPIVLFTTSSTKGEGKTFTALNTAAVFAANKKKVLLIGSDLRNPQLHSYLGLSRKGIGLSSYLASNDLSLKDLLVQRDKINVDFDIILSGEIPPNPAEILNNGRLEDLLDEARKIYDIIIVDTAPTMLVTDTLTIFDQADAIIYMIRANYTEIKILNHIKDLIKYKELNNIAIAINGVEKKKGYEYNYGYGYGYSADDKKKKWYQFS